MIEFKNKIYTGSSGRKSLFDCEIPKEPKAVIVFIHGYKGYKDWGCWNLVQDFYVKNGFGFVKFNLTHNGGTVEQPIDFTDLEAFGSNTYSKELFDLEIIIAETHRLIHQELEMNLPIYLLGHSRGGGIAILQSSRDKRIAKIISLAGISDIASRFPVGDELEDWRIDGVRFVENARTKQSMPHYFSLYEDFIANAAVLDIEQAAKSLTIPFLQIHGDMDTSVSISEGIYLAEWTDTQMKIIKGADHTFGSSQPWNQTTLPEDLEKAMNVAIDFFNTPTS